MQLRSQSIEWLNTIIPVPSVPSMSPADTTHSSKWSSLMGEVRNPILSNG